MGLQFGEVPPEPEFLEVEPLDSGTNIQSFRITTGTKARPLSFIMRVIRPEKPLEIGRLESDPEKVQRVYEQGCTDARAALAALKAWLEQENA